MPVQDEKRVSHFSNVVGVSFPVSAAGGDGGGELAELDATDGAPGFAGLHGGDAFPAVAARVPRLHRPVVRPGCTNNRVGIRVVQAPHSSPAVLVALEHGHPPLKVVLRHDAVVVARPDDPAAPPGFPLEAAQLRRRADVVVAGASMVEQNGPVRRILSSVDFSGKQCVDAVDSDFPGDPTGSQELIRWVEL
ncbi:unnamed protein product [Cuscuta europaea]|uniref:Uncharacterized protein n=1 Tax=Cuscuta europaea TaxID=41803 RepID=A0A9P1E0W4_CUSEU|nr:unnamed protein product [Cuscuta europaea]